MGHQNTGISPRGEASSWHALIPKADIELNQWFSVVFGIYAEYYFRSTRNNTCDWHTHELNLCSRSDSKACDLFVSLFPLQLNSNRFQGLNSLDDITAIINTPPIGDYRVIECFNNDDNNNNNVIE